MYPRQEMMENVENSTPRFLWCPVVLLERPVVYKFIVSLS